MRNLNVNGKKKVLFVMKTETLFETRKQRRHFYLNSLLYDCRFQNLEQRFIKAGIEYVIVLMSEIFPDKLRLFQDVDA